MQGNRESNRQKSPKSELRQDVVFWLNMTFGLALLCMSLGLWLGVRNHAEITALQTQLMGHYSGIAGDAFYYQLGGVLLLVYPYWLFSREVLRPPSKARLALQTAVLLVACLLAALCITYAKQGFPFAHRPNLVPMEQSATHGAQDYLAGLPGLNDIQELDAPSGYAARQMLIVGLYFILGMNPRVTRVAAAANRAWLLYWSGAILVALSVLVIWLRYASGSHSVPGVSLGLAAGVLAFWLVEVMLAAFARLPVAPQVGPALVWTFMTFVLFVTYGGSLKFWAVSWLLVVATLGIVVLLQERREDRWFAHAMGD